MDPDPVWDGWATWMDPAAVQALRGLLPGAAAATPAGALDALLRMAARRLAGRRFTVPGTGGDLSLRLQALEVRPDPMGLALGQFNDVRVAASDLVWRGTACHRVVLVCRNVHVRPLPAAAAVAAPVMVEVALRPQVVADLVATVRPWLRLEVGTDAEARLRWSRHPGWGSLALHPEVAGTGLHLQPGLLRLGRRRLALPRWLPPVRIAVPPLPRALRLRGVEVRPEEIVLHLVADEWREALPMSRLTQLLSGLR